MKPMKKWKEFIAFSLPWVTEEDINAVVSVMRTGWITTGPKVKEFESSFAGYVGAEHAISCGSCTAALHIALVAYGIGPGDEVITTPYTFASTGHVIHYCGATPVFVDIDPNTLNINPDLIEAQITEKTKAILPVHYGGHPCDMKAISDIAHRHGLIVIEDAAHALGSECNGKRIGSIGEITCFSFYATKNLTTAEGGMITTNNEALAKKMRILTMYGISDAREIWSDRYRPKGTWQYDVCELGFKYNMSDIQAAMGLSQMRRIDEITDRRRKKALIYGEELGGVAELRLLTEEEYALNCYHLYPVLLSNPDIRDDVMAQLKEQNIGTSVLFQPLHLHSFYQKIGGYDWGSYPVAEDIFRRIINLPISPQYDDEIICYVASCVRETVSNIR